MKKSFSMMELIFVIVIVGILASSMKFSLSNNELNKAVDQVMRDIYLTKHLALIDDKYQSYPLANNKVEKNRTKYWFKQWWQIRFSQNTGDKDYWYEVFTDLPVDNGYNFDKTGHYPYNPNSYWDLTFATDSNGKYLIGNCDKDKYPSCESVNKKLNLTKYYGIKKIEYENFGSSSHRLIFDNHGNIYLREGDKGDNGDINPYDIEKRVPLTKIAKITICQDDDCNQKASICIYPKTGYITRCD